MLNFVQLCNPMSVACQTPLSMGFFQARILEWVVLSFSRGFSWSRDGTHISCVSCTGSQILYDSTTCLSYAVLCLHGLQPTRLLCPWGFSRQEYRSGLPCPPPEDLPDPGIEPRSPASQVDSLPSELWLS